jgi:HEAT repeat protein
MQNAECRMQNEGRALRPSFARRGAWCLLVVAALASPAAAQDVRLLATKVADLLARFPAGSPADRDTLADQALALDEAGLTAIVKQIVSAGTGDDTAARFALNGVAVRASQGPEPKRLLAERAFIAGLGASADVEVRSFLLAQLGVVGREAAVKAATPLLADDRMIEPATQLMLKVKTPAAGAALLAGLGAAKGPARVTIVKALGELGVAAANPRLLAMLEEGQASSPSVGQASSVSVGQTSSLSPADAALRRAALSSLARIASPDSAPALMAAAKKAGYVHEPANATGALLEYAKRLGARGNRGAAEKVCRQVMQETDAPGRLATRAAALAVLADTLGQAAAPDLLKAVEHPDAAYRHAALIEAERRRIGDADQWVAKAKSVDAVRRAEIVEMLGRRTEARAAAFVRASLGAAEPEVAVAAAGALGHMERARAVPDLLAALKAASPAAAPGIAAVLGWTIDEKTLDPLVAMLDTLSPGAKAAALDMLGNRHGRRFAPRVLPLTTDANPEVRAAAHRALAGVVSVEHLPALLLMLDGKTADGKPGAGDEAPYVADLQSAVVAAAAQVTPEDQRAKPVLAAMKGASHPDRFVELLPRVGGRDALAVLVDLSKGTTPALKEKAFRALVQWPGPEAAERLFAIYADASLRDQAFSGFVRQISSSSLPDDQKVLQLRNALALNPPVRERRQLVAALGGARTFQSLMVVASYLDHPELKADAAAAAIRIALPSAGARDGLSGAAVRSALEKVVKALDGPEGDYDRENVRTYLRSMPTDEGFVPLFNGKDLTGWKGLVENPIARAKMTPPQLAEKQVQADARVRTTWSVRDGAIVFSGKGDNLCTVRDYGDFEMLVDWRITKDGDSGVYLRGSPQVQIWDPARTDVGAEVGSGGLYNNQKNPSKPLVFADNPVGEWNTFRIRMVGDKVTVFLNGIKVADQVTMENYWDRAQPIFPRGAIELQAHGTDLAFRDIYVRDLGGAPAELGAEERAQGFVPLFDGRSLDGWIGNLTGYKAENGVLTYDPKAGDHTNIYTAKEYSDFAFRFEFQLTPGANSGVGIRAPREGDAAYVGYEIQVLDDSAPVYAELQPYQYHGSVYGIIPAKRGALKPVGEWNSEEISVRGSRITITVNGIVTVDGDLAEATRNGPIDHKDHPGLKRTSGYIGFLSHDSVVRFRNLRIKDR